MNRPDDEFDPDAHLRAALRHAPDGDVTPPPYVSARILKASRQAVTPARRGPGLGGRIAAQLATAGRWLRQPGASAAFASLTLATVIGLMWQDGPPPEALQGERPVTTAGAPVVTASPPPTPAEPARDAAAAAAERVAPPAETAATGARSEDRSAPAAVAKAAAPAAAPVAPAADSAVADAAPAAPRADDASGLRERRVGSAESGAAAGARAALVPAPARQRAELAAAAAATDPLAELPAALAGTPAAEAWFAELRLRTQGRWQRAHAAALPADAQAVTAADGRPLGRIALADDAVLWQSAGPDAPRWRAALAPDTLVWLRAGLAAWAAPARTP